MRIRGGVEADIVKVSRLWLAMIEEQAPYLSPNVEWWRKLASASMRDGSYDMLILDDGGKLMGFLDWILYPEPSTGKVHAVGKQFFLQKEARGLGWGRQMYDAAMEIFSSAGASAVEFICLEPEKALWEKKGFLPVQYLLRKEI